MNMKLKKLLNDIQKTEDKIAELQEHLKRQNTLRQQMEDIEIVKSFRSMKLDSRSLLVLLDGIQKGTFDWYGFWGVSYLEALLRAADITCSKEGL